MTFLEEAKKMTVDNLKDCIGKGETFMPTAFFETEDKKKGIIMLPFGNEKEKEAVCKQLGRTLIDHNVKKFLLVTDAAMRIMDKKNAQYTQDNYESESPLTYPESMRTECLVHLSVDFTKETKESTECSVWCYKKENKEVIFLEEKSMGNDFQSKLLAYIAEGVQERIQELKG